MISITQLRIAQDGAAWKTSTMRGYLKKTNLDAATYGTGAFKLTFVKSGGTTYDFYFDVDTTVYTGTIPDATNLTLDRELLGHILTASWQSGTAEEYEQVRGGTGEW